MSERELNIIEILVNEEIQDLYKRPYAKKVKERYKQELRNILKKLNLKEYLNYDTWGSDKE